jgi:hypothetical protein
MDVEQLLAELEHLDESALEQLKEGIARRERELHAMQHPHTAEEWGAVVDQFLDEFWGETPAEEQKEIVDAIRFKNIPPDRDV